MQKLAIISLIYLEPEYQQTLDCIKATGLPIFYADRDGVGNMSRAFNEAFIKHVKGQFEYVWFVTNITFRPSIPRILLETIEGTMVDAIHPAMNSSDHKHLWLDNRNISGYNVPFIEFTAPMFRSSVFDKYMLCEQTPYYYMDLIISHQVRMGGGNVAVSGTADVDHVYLRNNKTIHPISEIRKKLRNYWTPLSRKYMVDTYGTDWENVLWPKT